MTSALAVIALSAGTALGAGEGPSTVTVGGGPPWADFEFSPTALLREEASPVSAMLSLNVQSTDGSLPPALSEITVELDRGITVDPTVVPRCPLGSWDGSMQSVTKLCPESVVGVGFTSGYVRFPEWVPFRSSTRLVVVRAWGGGLVALGNFQTAVGGNIRWPIGLTAIHDGRFRTLLRFHLFPSLGEGERGVMRLSLEFGVSHNSAGRRYSFFSGSCEDGRLQVHLLGSFVTGGTAQTEAIRTCTPKAG